MKTTYLLKRTVVALPFIFSLSHAHAQTCSLEFVATPAISGTPILTWDDATKISTGGTVGVTLAQDTYTAASFVIRAKSGTCSNLSFVAQDLTLSDNTSQKLAKEKIAINYVKKWWQASTAWVSLRNTAPRKLVPELLLNDPDLVKVDLSAQKNFIKLNKNGTTSYTDISDGSVINKGIVAPDTSDFDVRDSDKLQPIQLDSTPQQMWLSISTAADTKPGKYKGTISVQQGTNKLVQVPLEVTVLSFKLPDPKLEYSIFYRSKLVDGEGTISPERRSEDQYRAELADLKRHGISNPAIYQPNVAVTFTKAMALRKEAGFTSPRFYYFGMSAASATTQSATDQMKSLIKNLQSKLSPLGYSDLYLPGLDEAKAEAMTNQLPSWGIVQAQTAKVMATGYVGSYDTVGNKLDLMILAGEPNNTEIGKFHSAGKRVLTYAFPQSGPENPEVFRRNYGVKLWSTDTDGAMPFAYMHAYGFDWNDFDGDYYRDHNFVYPTANGVISTLAWEGMHEAIEDVRYLTALEAAVQSANGNSNCTASAACKGAVSKARTYLDQLKATVDKQADLYKVRADIIAQLQDLSAASPPAAPVIQLIQ